MLVLLASASVPSWPRWQTANGTNMTNTCGVYTVLGYSWWWTVDLSETCTVLYQTNLRKCASRWLLLQEYWIWCVTCLHLIRKKYLFSWSLYVHGSNTATTHTIWCSDGHQRRLPKPYVHFSTGLFQLPATAVTDDEVELIWKESIVKTVVQIVELFEDSIEPIKRLPVTTVADSSGHTT
jgi:hypothetical protein